MPGYVLAAEDDADLRCLLEARLRSVGYSVESVADGRQALERALVSAPQLIITDFQMPEMNGLELIVALRCDTQLAQIPVILYTGSGPEPRLLEGLQQLPGVIHVVSKGRLAELLRVIGSLVDQPVVSAWVSPERPTERIELMTPPESATRR